jgi:hypothetical protein
MRARQVIVAVWPVLALACGGQDGDDVGYGNRAGEGIEVARQELRARTQVIPLGVLVDETATPGFRQAAELAETQVNDGLARARSRYRFDVVLGNALQTRAEAIRLVNTSGVLGLVTDISGNTVQANRLNYDPANPIAYKVPITCYQCSSAFINDPAAVDPDPISQAALRDADNWLWRSFFNGKFESAVQVQLVLNKPASGDFNGDGHLKIAVYFDGFHASAASTLVTILPQMYSGSSSVETIAMTLPGTPESRAAELARVLDGLNENTGATDGPPDAVYLALLPGNAPGALASYRATGTTTPVQANNGVRRNFLLPTLGAAAEGLEGSSVSSVADGRSGTLFARAFRAATGSEPELTASYAYDAVVTQMLAALVAAEDNCRRTLTAAQVRAALGKINARRGEVIRPEPAEFADAAREIARGDKINYEGASSSLDWTATGEQYPRLVHWKIQGGKFVELESYQCNEQIPLCRVEN